jgi:hypothetical protein
MYFWNTYALAKELKEGTLDQKEKVKYFIIFVLTEYLFFDLAYLLDEPSAINYPFEPIFYTLIVGFGIYLCFRINQRGDNSEFIDRFVCIGFPIAIRFIVALIGIVFVLAAVSAGLGDDFDPWVDEESLIQLAEGVALTIVFYWRVWVALKWISHPTKNRG